MVDTTAVDVVRLPVVCNPPTSTWPEKRPEEAVAAPLVLIDAACTPDVNVAALAVKLPAALTPLFTDKVPAKIPLDAVRCPLREAEPAVSAPPLETLPTKILLPPTLRSARDVTLFALTKLVMLTELAVSEPAVLIEAPAINPEDVTALTVISLDVLSDEADTRPVIRAVLPVIAAEELKPALVTVPAVLTEPNRMAEPPTESAPGVEREPEFKALVTDALAVVRAPAELTLAAATLPTTAADAAVRAPVVLKPPTANRPVRTPADAVTGPEAEKDPALAKPVITALPTVSVADALIDCAVIGPDALREFTFS